MPDFDKFFEPYAPLEKSKDRYFTTPNYLSPLSFRVIIPRCPKITYFVQSVSLPSVIVTSMEIPAYKGLPRQEMPSGLDITDQIIVNFSVDENMENWQEVYDWMTSIVSSNENNASVDDDANKFSEIVILVYNNAKIAKKKFTFHKCFPVNLSSIEFNSSSTEADPILMTVNFDYSHFTVETL